MELTFRTLNANEIDCRIQSVTEKGLILLLYKDARIDQKLLDEVVVSFTLFKLSLDVACTKQNEELIERIKLNINNNFLILDI